MNSDLQEDAALESYLSALGTDDNNLLDLSETKREDPG